MVTSPASFFMAASGGQAPFDSTLIGNSIWLEGAETSGDAMTRIWGAESNQDRWIWATWFQPLRLADAVATRSVIFAGGNSGHGFYLRHNSTASTFNIFHRDNAGSEGAINTTESYRDLTAWIHVLVDYDSANANAEDRISLYVNGVRTGVNSGNRPGQNNNINVNVQNQTAHIGQDISTTPNYHMKGYLAQTVFLDNKSIVNGDLALTDFLDTFTFGTNGSQIVPKADADIIALASAAGANSFCLDFSSSSDLGNDASSKNNDFSTSTIVNANQSLHSPSKVYATWNALDSALDGHNTDMSLSDGGTVTEDGNGAFCRSTFAIPEGLFSYRVTGDDSTSNQMFGVALDTATDRASGATNHSNMYAVNTSNGERNTNGSGSSAVSGYSWSDGDTMEVYVSRSGTTYKIWYGKNGTLLNNASGSQGDPSAGTNELFSFTHTTDVFFSVDYSNPGTKKATTDFGQRGYSPAEGALTLSTPNLLTPSYQGIDYFDATLYEGNGFNQRVGNFVPFTDTYTVDKSVFFDDGDRRYLAKTFDSGDPTATSTPGGSNSAKATISFWIKYNRSVGSGDQYIFSTANTAQTQRFMIYRNEQSAEDFFFINMNPGPKMFKAPVQSALLSEQEWSNVVINVDLDNSTGADKVKMFVNGVQITSVDTTYQSASNSNYFLFANEDHFIGNLAPASAGYTGFCLDSYLAEMHVIDGHVKAPTDFGQVDTATNRWVAKDYKTNVNTYGNRGFYMAFDNASGTSDGVGTDSSGNGYTFTESFVSGGSAWTSTDTVTDTPSKNFATLSSTRKSAGTLSEGNLSYDSGAASSVTLNCLATMPIPSSGKWAVKIINTTTGTNFGSVGVGYMGTTDTLVSASAVSTTGTHGVYFSGGTTRINGVSGPTLSTWKRPADGANPFVELFFDRDANTFKSKVNGGSLETITSFLTEKQITFALIAFAGSTGSQYEVDFGQKGYTPSESGFLTLNQDNLDDTASKITAWAWIKNRDADDNHMLFDRVRGVGKDLQLFASSTVAEATDASTLQRFLQRGVQVGNDAKVNTVNESYVLWQWLVGDSATTGTVIPADNPPSIASTVITADAGHFSVGTFTGAGGSSTIGHGLPAAPEFFLVKRIGTSGTGWFIYSKDTSDPNNKFLRLQTAGIEGSASGAWTPGATTMGLNESSLNGINTSGVEHLFIAFRSVPGVCKIGSYTGNGDSNGDGTYISTGFAPKWLFIKRNDSTTDAAWWTLDTVRDNDGNPTNHLLRLNTNGVEGANNASLDTDFLSDGFKPRSNYGGINANNGTYIYMAMADIAGGGTLPPIYGR